MHIPFVILSTLFLCIHSAPTQRTQIKRNTPSQLEKTKLSYEKCKAEILLRKYDGALTVRNVKEAISLRNKIDNCFLMGKKIARIEEEMSRLTRNQVKIRENKNPMHDAEVTMKATKGHRTSMNALKNDRKLLTKFITSGGDQMTLVEKKNFSLKKPVVHKILGTSKKETRVVKNAVSLNVIGASGPVEVHRGLSGIAPHVITA